MLALAPLLRIPHYYLVGGFLTVTPIASVLCIPATIMVAGEVLQSWTIISGIVCGLAFLSLGYMNIQTTIRIRRGQHWLTRQPQAFVVQRSYSGLLNG